MAPCESQFEKFDSILAKISDKIDSGECSSTGIYDEIKNQLRENFSTIYEEWKKSNFNPSFKFKLCNSLNRVKKQRYYIEELAAEEKSLHVYH